MAKDKNQKTNAMRILDKNKIPYKVNYYECEEFIDGIHIADMLSQSYDMTFKTLVAQGKSAEYYVFVLPIDRELDLKKAAKSVGEKICSTSARKGHQDCDRLYPRRLHCHRYEKAVQNSFSREYPQL